MVATRNPHKYAKQAVKAAALATTLRELDVLSENIHLITWEQWCQLAIVAKVTAPSDETIAIVVDLVRKMENFGA